jgi:hypothetical protein
MFWSKAWSLLFEKGMVRSTPLAKNLSETETRVYFARVSATEEKKVSSNSDQVMQIADFEAEGAPLADRGDPGEVVPILGSGSALEAAHVDRHLGHLTTKLDFFCYC